MKIIGLYRPDVVTAELVESVAKAAKRMRLHEISALPVVEHDRVLDILTERDITRAVAEEMDPHTATVADIMTQHPLVATPDDEAKAVATRMLEHGISPPARRGWPSPDGRDLGTGPADARGLANDRLTGRD